MIFSSINKLSLVNSRPLTIKPGYILSKYMDPLVFVGISIAALLAPLVFQIDSVFRQLFISYLIYDTWLSFGHAAGGVYPVLFSVKNKNLKLTSYLLMMLGCMAFSVALFNFHMQLFFAVIASSLMWHYTRQKVGWIQYSTRKIKEQKSWVDEIMIYNVCLVPFLWHLTDSQMEYKTLYLFSDLNLFTLPSSIPLHLGSFSMTLNLGAIFVSIFWSINLLWLFKETKQILTTGVINPVKYYVICSGILCFAVSYMLFPDKFMFWIPNVFVHTTSYILFTYYFSKSHKLVQTGNNKSKVQYSFLKNLFLYLVLILIYGSVLLGMSEYGISNTSSWWRFNFMLPLAFSFFFIHYITDAFIWKKRFMKPAN